MPIAVWYVAAGALVLGGLAGTVLPVVPGPLLVFAGLFLAAWADGFSHVGAVPLAIIAVLGALCWAADFVAGALGARRLGASTLAVVLATVGGVVGLFLGIPGLIAGPFVGAVAGELLSHKGLPQAARVGFGTWLGLVAALVAKVFLSLMMVATFLVARIF
jgi:uncharacterized protein YqgC (DUF456 family)